MRRFWSFSRKEFFHIIRDWQTLLILIGMPITQILLFGYAISNEIQESDIAVIDRSRSVESRTMIARLEASEQFNVVHVLQSTEDATLKMKRGEISLAVVFPPDFSENTYREGGKIIPVISDSSDPNTSTLLVNYVQQLISSSSKSTNTSERVAPVSVKVVMAYNPRLEGAYLFVPGTISVILMLISAMMTSISIAREKEMGTMEVVLATPMQPLQIILAKVMPYLLLSLVNGLVVLLMGHFIFEIPIHGSLYLLFAEMLLFIITSLALGILISSITDSQQVALMISLMGLMLPTLLLSGFIFPVENMPKPLQLVSNIVPAKYFLIVIKGIMIKGQGLEVFWKETAILIGFALVFIAISIRKFKVRLS